MGATASPGHRQVQRGAYNHINRISATRMTVVPSPISNNPISAMAHPVGINSLRSHSTVGDPVSRIYGSHPGKTGSHFLEIRRKSKGSPLSQKRRHDLALSSAASALGMTRESSSL
jgi:hypothetical protein